MSGLHQLLAETLIYYDENLHIFFSLYAIALLFSNNRQHNSILQAGLTYLFRVNGM